MTGWRRIRRTEAVETAACLGMLTADRLPLNPGWPAGLVNTHQIARLSLPSPVTLLAVKHRVPIVVIGVLLVATTSCRRDPVFADMSDSTFVRTMIALRKLPVSPADTALRARQRDSILDSMGVTAAQVESTAVRLASDPALAARIWRAIETPGAPSPP